MSPHVMAASSPFFFLDRFDVSSDTLLSNHSPEIGSAWGAGPSSTHDNLTVYAAGGLGENASAGTLQYAHVPDTPTQADVRAIAQFDFAGHTTDGDRINIWLRDDAGTTGTGNGNGYQFRLDADGACQLVSYDDGVDTLLDSAPAATADVSAAVAMTCEAIGTAITFTIDHAGGQTVLSATDSTHTAAGEIVLYWVDLPTTAQFLDLKVELP